jgi:hypothetical protein
MFYFPRYRKITPEVTLAIFAIMAALGLTGVISVESIRI